ncbi:hypothetical protein H0H81_006902, partial [Sphagnurus paluster]
VHMPSPPRQATPPDIEMGPPSSPPLPLPTETGRGARQKRPTWKLLKQLPAPPTPIPPPDIVENPNQDNTEDEDQTPPPLAELVWNVAVRTLKNAFGLYREYPSRPTHNPDDTISLPDLSNTGTVPPTTALLDPTQDPVHSKTSTSYYPFQNSTACGLMNWMWTGSPMKSLQEVSRLIDFLKSDKFVKEDLTDFDLRKETACLDTNLQARPSDNEGSPSMTSNDGWIDSDVVIEMPDGKKHPDPSTILKFTIPGLRHRSLVEIIQHVFSDPNSAPLHYTPLVFKSHVK